MGDFKFGRSSNARLRGVHPVLRWTAKLALERSPVDFSIIEGVRSAKRQAQLRAAGASQVRVSQHQKQDDGYGHALDLAPYIGRVQFEIVPMLQIADAMFSAAAETSCRLRWGGCWCYPKASDSARELMQRYIDRRRAQGRVPFVDAWHFEIRQR